ncbi:MAG: ATP-binding protein [Tunicatimonas sp.]
MPRLFTRNNKSLPVAGAALLLAALMQWCFIEYFRSEDRYLGDITRAVERALHTIENDNQALKNQLDEASLFKHPDFSYPAHYPYYIFHNGRLRYWSDYRQVPDYGQLQGNYTYAYRTLPSGSYLVRRDSTEAPGMEIFFLLPIRHDTKIDNQYVSAGYNPTLFPEGASATMAAQVVDLDDKARLVRYQNEPLFAVTLQAPAGGYREHRSAKLFQSLISALVALAIGLVLFNLGRVIRWDLRRGHVDRAILLFTLSLLGLRTLMLVFNFPYTVLPLQLFDYRYFASSAVNPSLGDLLLNCLCVLLIVVFLFNYYYATRTYRWLWRAPRMLQSGAAVVLFLLGIAALYAHYAVVETIYVNSQWTLDITKSVSFTALKNVSLGVFILNSASYFLVAHMVFRTFISLSQRSYFSLQINLAIAVGLALLGCLSAGLSAFLVLLISLSYFALLHSLQLTKYLARVRYITFLYVFASTLVSAITCALVAYHMHGVETEDNKQKFANQLLVDNDVLGELLLTEVRDKIEDDLFIRQRLGSPLAGLFGGSGGYEVVRQKIERIYLNDYFDKYAVDVYLYDAEGLPLENKNRRTYQEYREDLAAARFDTGYPDLFFINQSNVPVGNGSRKQYLLFVEVPNGASVAGHIIVVLTLKQFAPNRVYPELLIDRTYSGAYPTNEYDYAYFTPTGRLTFSNGDESAFRPLRQYDFRQRVGSGETIDRAGYSYLVVEGKGNDYIAIASPAYSIANVVSNFSFLFLLLVFAVLFLLAGYSIYFAIKRANLNFSTKIQLYLNAAFFMPLLAVSVTTLSIISNSYNEEVDEQYLEKVEQIGDNVASFVAQYQQGQTTQEALTNTLSQIAKYAETDVNVFDTTGALVVTSQPQIYENNLLSDYINPEALTRIKSRDKNKLVLDESVGSLSYKSSYTGLRSPSTGQLMGLLSIPFFESRNQVEEQIIEVLTNMMNIFTFVFIAFLIISYLASMLLTYPLKYITQKIKRTSLSDYNEPLSWESNDEIGLMVGEYNRMLVNLEASKAALARTEKESAWREMAKQVAHEIKNPLTPMKLSLQHLKRRLQEEYHAGMNAQEVQAVEKPVDNLLLQVDTLNDIASSFSSFAQMPIPKSELYELEAVMRKTVGLYEDGQQEVSLSIQGSNFWVVGDEQLMGRILSNLIINAKQSVPREQKPCITVSLQRAGLDRLILKVSDNGTGIAREIQNKVFMPNFSTKYAGSGIGLAIAKRGIEHAGGRITFDSQAGVGTTFFIELPLRTNGVGAVRP